MYQGFVFDKQSVQNFQKGFSNRQNKVSLSGFFWVIISIVIVYLVFRKKK